MKRSGSGELWMVAALVAAAILIRATRLTESLWYDEIAAWFTFGVLGPGGIVSGFTEPANHVAHTLLSWCSVQAFQDAVGFELALRIPALVFSAGAVAAMAMLARVALGRVRDAVLAAGIMAVAPVAVLEGVEARGYSMMICCSALASWALLANLHQERRWRWLLYAAVCALGTWAHFVTAFVPIGHAAWLAWLALRGRASRGWVLRAAGAVALAAVLSLALYAPALDDLLVNRGQYAAARGDEPRVLGPEGWHALLQLGGSWYAWAAAPGLVLAAAGLVACLRTPRRDGATDPSPADAVAVTLAGLPLFLLVVLVSGSWMYARFALFSLPGAVLLMAAGLDAIIARRRIAGLAAAAVLLAVYAADLVVRPPKQPLRDAAEFVRRHLAPGESILVIGIAHRVMDLYLADLEPDYSLMHGADLRRDLAPLPRPAWVIIYYPGSVSPERYALLDAAGYTEAARFKGWVDWNNGDVVVLTKSGSSLNHAAAPRSDPAGWRPPPGRSRRSGPPRPRPGTTR